MTTRYNEINTIKHCTKRRSSSVDIHKEKFDEYVDCREEYDVGLAKEVGPLFPRKPSLSFPIEHYCIKVEKACNTLRFVNAICNMQYLIHDLTILDLKSYYLFPSATFHNRHTYPSSKHIYINLVILLNLRI